MSRVRFYGSHADEARFQRPAGAPGPFFTPSTAEASVQKRLTSVSTRWPAGDSASTGQRSGFKPEGSRVRYDPQEGPANLLAAGGAIGVGRGGMPTFGSVESVKRNDVVPRGGARGDQEGASRRSASRPRSTNHTNWAAFLESGRLGTGRFPLFLWGVVRRRPGPDNFLNEALPFRRARATSLG